MGSVWPFKITTDQQSILGYDDGFCLECQIGDQKSISKPFKLAQTSKCLTTLTSNPVAFQHKYLDFQPDVTTDDKYIGKSYKAFFTNTDTINCPVEKCEVMQKGCKAPFLKTSTDYFTVIVDKDFALQAS